MFFKKSKTKSTNELFVGHFALWTAFIITKCLFQGREMVWLPALADLPALPLP